MQKDATMKTLRAMGFDSEDLTILADEMIGKTVAGFAKESKPNKDGKVFVNVYFGSAGNEPTTELSKDEVLKRLGRVFGSKSEQPKQSPEATTTTPLATESRASVKSPFKR
jgi:hypothetical protein